MGPTKHFQKPTLPMYISDSETTIFTGHFYFNKKTIGIDTSSLRFEVEI